MIFGIILLPISLVAAIAAFPLGLIILAINIWILWYALRCRKEYKTLKISNTESQSMPNSVNETSARTEALPEKDKKKIIEIPDHIGEYELKYRYPDVPFTITGDLGNAVGGEVLTFVANENNIDVCLENEKIGVMQDARKDMVRDFLNRSEPIKAVLSAFDGVNEAKMFLAFYKLPRYTILIQGNAPRETVKLAGTSKKEYQETILFCSVGDIIEIDYDEDQERYYAESSDRIGYFPKKINSKLENSPETFISKIDFDDNGNYIVFVDIFG